MNTIPLTVICPADHFNACVGLAQARLRLWLPDACGVKLTFEVAKDDYKTTVENCVRAGYEVITYAVYPPTA